MKTVKLFEEFLNEETQFPAQFEIGEPVSFKTSEEDEERWGSVVKVSFTKAKVFYDILDDYTSTVVEFIDSAFIKPLKSDIKLEEPTNEAKETIIDYSNSKNKILVGLKTDLLRNMKDRYDYKEDGDSIYFFDKGEHIGTLFDLGSRYQELKHNGKLDDKGWLKESTNEAKESQYPQEVQDILKNMADNLPIKKYQLGAFNNYGVWFIELPFTAIHSGNLKKIEKFLPDFSIGIYQGYSGLSIRTNISI